MQIQLRLFGLDILDLSITTDTDDVDNGTELNGGTLTATPIGFTPSPPDPLERWTDEDRTH